VRLAIAWGAAPMSFRLEAARKGFEVVALARKPADIQQTLQRLPGAAVAVQTAQDVLDVLSARSGDTTFLVCPDRDIPTIVVWDVQARSQESGGYAGLYCSKRPVELPPPECIVHLRRLPEKTTAE